MSLEGINKSEKKPLTISEVPVIEATRNQVISSRESIKNIVEGPLVSACEQFYDKNIVTHATSANAKDLHEGYGYIIIDYDYLSPQNKLIANQFGEPIDYDEMQAVKIKIPITSSSTAEDIIREADRIAALFKFQTATWIEQHTYTLEQLKEIYGITDPNIKPEDFIDPEDKEDRYYDSKTELFYPSEELFRKMTQES